jgi:hypothetical protein
MDINQFLNMMECIAPIALSDEKDAYHNGLIVEGGEEITIFAALSMQQLKQSIM